VVNLAPRRRGTGAFGHSRKTTVRVAMSGVKATRTLPVTVCMSGAIATRRVYRGRCGSGAGYACTRHGEGVGRSAVVGVDEPKPHPAARAASGTSIDASVAERSTTK
jgi:hypothetical protein